VLITIILVLQAVLLSFKYYTQQHRSDNEIALLRVADSVMDATTETNHFLHDTHFKIDPNTAPVDAFVKVGFPSYIAHRIVRYREKGGKFYRLSDICKIYGVDTSLVYRLKNHWVFPQREYDDKRNAGILEKIELNTADTAILETLPGIGKVLAARIIKYRDLLGGFYAVHQLQEVYGLSTETYQRIVTRLWVDTTQVRPLVIATATFKDIARHPYLGYHLAKKIEAYRKQKVRISLERLIQDTVVTSSQAELLRRYCVF